MPIFYVYIISNYNLTTYYTGFTDDLARRMQEHKQKLHSNSFSARYNLNQLLYYKEFTDMEGALAYEKRVKRYKTEWKENLINEQNPNRRDLYEDFELKD